MIEKLIETEARHNSEFRAEMRQEIREIKHDVKSLNNTRSSNRGKIAVISGFFSMVGAGIVTFFAKYFGGHG